jgi:hypothetical protein
MAFGDQASRLPRADSRHRYADLIIGGTRGRGLLLGLLTSSVTRSGYIVVDVTVVYLGHCRKREICDALKDAEGHPSGVGENKATPSSVRPK